MAHHLSALKAHRQSLKHRSQNRSNRSRLRTVLRQFEDRLKSGKTEEVRPSLSEIYSLIDRTGQKKAISKNAAARKKSRLARRLNSVVAPAPKA
jgi:small subunit ribosomal protein S20